MWRTCFNCKKQPTSSTDFKSDQACMEHIRTTHGSETHVSFDCQELGDYSSCYLLASLDCNETKFSKVIRTTSSQSQKTGVQQSFDRTTHHIKNSESSSDNFFFVSFTSIEIGILEHLSMFSISFQKIKIPMHYVLVSCFIFCFIMYVLPISCLCMVRSPFSLASLFF